MKPTTLVISFTAPLGVALATAATALAATIVGTPGDDDLVGTPQADTIRGFDGSDTLWGLRGADTLHGGLGKDTLHGGPGPDVLWDRRAGLLFGGPGDDRLYGSHRSNQNGGSGDDFAQVVGGSAHMASGSDLVHAVGRDVGMQVWAGDGDDRINVGAPYTGGATEPPADFVFDCGAGYDSFHWYTSSNPGAPQAPYSWAETRNCEEITVHERLTP